MNALEFLKSIQEDMQEDVPVDFFWDIYEAITSLEDLNAYIDERLNKCCTLETYTVLHAIKRRLNGKE